MCHLPQSAVCHGSGRMGPAASARDKADPKQMAGQPRPGPWLPKRCMVEKQGDLPARLRRREVMARAGSGISALSAAITSPRPGSRVAWLRRVLFSLASLSSSTVPSSLKDQPRQQGGGLAWQVGEEKVETLTGRRCGCWTQEVSVSQPWPLSGIHSFTHSFFHSFVHSFIHSLTHLFTHLFIHSFICSFVHSFIHSLVHSTNLLSVCSGPVTMLDIKKKINLCSRDAGILMGDKATL